LLRGNGIADVTVIDSNEALRRHLVCGGEFSDYVEWLADEIASMTPDWVGFSSICSCYHVTLSIVEALKRRSPELTVVLGGPQASATAQATLRECSGVDFVLCGEAERSIGAFLEHARVAPERVPGLAWRRDGQVCVNAAASPPDMEATPAPAFDLWDFGQVAGMPLEVGRGCPFSCRFCSTSGYFGHQYRVKPPKRVVAEALELRSRYGCETVELIHDHLGAHKDVFLALCAAWRSEPGLEGVGWTCSLRADAVDGEVVETLRSSGCTAVFIGVETGSERMQRVVGKRLRLDRAREALRRLSEAGLKCKVAFIGGFPEETAEDFSATLSFFEWTMFLHGMRPQMATLAPLAGSAYGEEWKPEAVYTGRLSDMAAQNASYGGSTLAFLKEHPALCSTHYSIPLHGLDGDRLYASVRFLKYGVGLLGLPLRAGVRLAGGLETLLALWLADRWGDRLFESEYYVGGRFRREMMEFLRALPERLGHTAEEAARCRCLLDMHDLDDEHLAELERRRKVCSASPEEAGEDPMLGVSCLLSAYPFPFEELAQAVMDGVPLSSVAQRRSLVVRVETDDGVSATAISPLSAAVLTTFAEPRRLSDGLDRLMRDFGALLPAGIPAESGFVFSIQTLLDSGHLGFVSCS